MDKPNGRIFFLKMMTCYKYIILFGITSALIKKKKIKPHGDEVTDFYDKKIPQVDTNQFSSKQFRFCSRER